MSNTFADFEVAAEEVIDKIGRMDAGGMILRLEKLILVLDRSLTAQIETDDTPFGFQWTIETLHRLFFALDQRISDIRSTLTADEARDVNTLTERLAKLFQHIIIRAERFCDAAKKFETFNSGSIN